MRAVLALLLLAPVALAHHGDAVLPYLDEAGRFRAGLVAFGVGAVDDGALGVGPVNLARLRFAADACHPRLQVLLDYAPANASVRTDAVGGALAYEMLVELFDDSTGERLPNSTKRFSAPGTAWYPLPEAAADGRALRVDLYLLVGAEVDWRLRVRGWEDPALPCGPGAHVSEVESNPAGWDEGNEWIEIRNPGLTSLDLSGWTVRALHGTPASLVLADGTTVGPDGRLVVAFPTQFLDNVDEVVVLEDALGAEVDRTPALSDGENDGRSWQRDLEGAWAFAEATPGS